LKAVWLEIFGTVFCGFPAEIDPLVPPGSPGRAPHIKMHEKSAPQTHFKTISWHPQKARQTAFSQVPRPSEFPARQGGSGYLKAVWLEIVGQVFFGFPAEIDPRDHTP